jgi:hypothetical protein
LIFEKLFQKLIRRISFSKKLVNAVHISGEANPDNTPGIRTQMLTVWRRLHIEVDSMGNVSGNNVTGTFPANVRVSSGQRTLSVTTTNPLEVNRFENGRMVIVSGSITRSLTVIDATPSVDANTANTVTVLNTLGTFNITGGDTFTLYDDDDFNDDDGTTLDGDNGEDVSEPITGISLLTANSDNPTDNILAPAYIRPVYDITDTQDNSSFTLNSTSLAPADTRRLFVDQDLTTTNTDAGFWTVYVLYAYQGPLDVDQDPMIVLRQSEPGLFGIVDGIPNVLPEGSGALIFMELHNRREITGYPGPPSLQSVANTVGHEVGHLVGGEHFDGGIMTDASGTMTSAQFTDITLAKIRRITHP